MMCNVCCSFVRQVKVATKPSTAGRKSGVFQEQFDDQSDSANASRDQRKKGRAQVDNRPPPCACACTKGGGVLIFTSALDALTHRVHRPATMRL